jgi:hypothetical protein
MQGEKERALREALAKLREEHRGLDEAILTLESAVHKDQLQISRLKRQKLKVKDQMALIEDQLLPDIIA